MVSFPEHTTQTESTATVDESDGTEEPDAAEEDAAEPGLLARAAAFMQNVADVLSPFTALLTAIVQAYTVKTLVT